MPSQMSVKVRIGPGEFSEVGTAHRLEKHNHYAEAFFVTSCLSVIFNTIGKATVHVGGRKDGFKSESFFIELIIV